MTFLLQKIKPGAKVPNKEVEETTKEEFSSLFTEEDEKQCEHLCSEDQIVYKIKKMYHDEENGLRAIFRDLGAPQPAVPEREINILIIGNHSSGKSTFINWYVGENIQKTGVAMETSNFTVVCHGKERETLTAGAVMKKFPALEIFEKIPGAIDHLSGETSTSTKHRFGLVNFIDSPGIVDGPRYNFQFDRAMEACAQMADLIFVFFDPHGQGLCQRTMTILERLYKTHPGKLSLWMTKCDMLKDEADLVKVTQQITREIYRSEEARNLAPMLTPIYVPGHSDYQPPGLNKLSDARSLIDKSIAAHLQNKVLGSIAHHCSYLEKLNEEKLAAEERRFSKGGSSHAWLRMFLYLTILLTVITIGFAIVDAEYLVETLENIVDRTLVVNMKTRFHKSLTEHIQPEMEMPVLAGVLFCVAVLAWLGAREPSAVPVKKDDAIARPWYRNNIDRINNIRREADQLFRDYLERVLHV